MAKVYSWKNVKKTLNRGELSKYAVDKSATAKAGTVVDREQQQNELDKRPFFDPKLC